MAHLGRPLTSNQTDPCPFLDKGMDRLKEMGWS